MYSFGNEIKKLRIKHNLKQEEFAEILTEEAEKYEKQTGDKVKPEKGFKKGVISRWENNVVEPRIDIVRLVSKAFNIDANILLGITSEEDVSEVYEAEVTNVPLIGSIAAGEPIFVEENIEGYIPVIKSSLKQGKTYFFMTVKGESMNREFKTGSKVLIEKGSGVESGDIVAIRINGDEATVKKVLFDERSVTVVPMSNNPDFQPKTFYRDEIEIVIEGKVVQAIKEY